MQFVRGSAEAPRLGTFSTAVWNLGKVVDQIVYLLRRCQNLGAASSYPVQTRQDTIDEDCCVREYKIRGERDERLTLFVFLLIYWLLLVIYNPIVLQQGIIYPKVLHTTYSSNVGLGIHCYCTTGTYPYVVLLIGYGTR